MKKFSLKLNETVEYLKNKIPDRPEIGLILGSGLGVMAEEIEEKVSIAYNDIPHFPTSTVEGHASQLIVGKLMGKKVITMQGRFHFYEGYSLEEVTYPIKVMKKLGVNILLVTNAAGGINIDFKPADLMLIEDHINLTGQNPLIGPNDPDMGPRFPDMSEAYNMELRNIAQDVARQQGVELRKGVYVGLTGPTYETPAEIKFLRTIGADATGMSTVPEVIIANHLDMKILGISCITNMAAGVLNQRLSHEEVVEVGNQVREKFSRLIKGIIQEV